MRLIHKSVLVCMELRSDTVTKRCYNIEASSIRESVSTNETNEDIRFRRTPLTIIVHPCILKSAPKNDRNEFRDLHKFFLNRRSGRSAVFQESANWRLFGPIESTFMVRSDDLQRYPRYNCTHPSCQDSPPPRDRVARSSSYVTRAVL